MLESPGWAHSSNLSPYKREAGKADGERESGTTKLSGVGGRMTKPREDEDSRRWKRPGNEFSLENSTRKRSLTSFPEL